MAQTLKFGNKVWAAKEDSVLAYNDINNNYKPLPFTFSRASIGTRVNKDGLIETMGQDIARIDYTDSADGVLLLEPSSTNRFLYSEDLTQFDLSSSGTGASNPVVTSNYAISPDGTQNADRVQLDAGTDASGNSRITETFTIFATTETISVYLKSNDGQEYTIDVIQSNSAQNTATVTSKWQRFSFTNLNGSPDKYGIGLTGINGETADILAWGFQLEQSTYATSYIPTSGSSVTRAAETCNNSGNSEVFNDSEGVLFANISALSDDGTNRVLSLSNGSYSNSIRIQYYTVSNQLEFRVVSSNSAVVLQRFTINNVTLFNKILVKYKLNDFAMWVNGFELITDTNGATPVGLDEIRYDDGDGNVPFYGNTKELGYYNTILTDLELETLTSYRNWVSMVNELNLNIIYNG